MNYQPKHVRPANRGAIETLIHELAEVTTELNDTPPEGETQDRYYFLFERLARIQLDIVDLTYEAD